MRFKFHMPKKKCVKIKLTLKFLPFSILYFILFFCNRFFFSIFYWHWLNLYWNWNIESTVRVCLLFYLFLFFFLVGFNWKCSCCCCRIIYLNFLRGICWAAVKKNLNIYFIFVGLMADVAMLITATKAQPWTWQKQQQKQQQRKHT